MLIDGIFGVEKLFDSGNGKRDGNPILGGVDLAVR